MRQMSTLQGKLRLTTNANELEFGKLVLNNKNGNTKCLVWLITHCVGFILFHESKSTNF